MNLTVSVRKVVWLLVLVAVVLMLSSIAVQIYKTFSGSSARGLFGLVQLFDVRKEESIPTWFSEVLLLLCSVLLAIISIAARQERGRHAGYWLGLSAIFLFLSADEGASIHEKMGQLGKFILSVLGLRPSGFLTYAWVVPAAFLLLVFALVFLRFFLRLPTKYQLLFFTAGAVFVGGALFLESLSAFYVSFHGGQRNMSSVEIVTLIGITTAEESSEMAGAIIFIYALLSYIRDNVRDIGIRIDGKAAPTRHER